MTCLPTLFQIHRKQRGIYSIHVVTMLFCASRDIDGILYHPQAACRNTFCFCCCAIKPRNVFFPAVVYGGKYMLLLCTVAWRLSSGQELGFFVLSFKRREKMPTGTQSLYQAIIARPKSGLVGTLFLIFVLDVQSSFYLLFPHDQKFG